MSARGTVPAAWHETPVEAARKAPALSGRWQYRICVDCPRVQGIDEYGPAGERTAITPAAVAAPTRTTTPAMSTRRRCMRRFASAISGSSEKGSLGTCNVIALVSLAPPALSIRAARGHSGPLAQASLGPEAATSGQAVLTELPGRNPGRGTSSARGRRAVLAYLLLADHFRFRTSNLLLSRRLSPKQALDLVSDRHRAGSLRSRT
jgi:hypothetical protein